MRIFSLSHLLPLLTASVFAADWLQWMGPQRDGVWREDGLCGKFAR